MPKRDGKTVPYESKKQVAQGARYLEGRYDPAVALGFRIGGATALRISDVIHLKYDENINYETNTIRLVESKRFKQAQSQARIKALKKFKGTLFAVLKDDVQKAQLLMCADKDIYDLVPIRFLPTIDKSIAEFVGKVKKTWREIKVPKKLMNKIKARQKKFKGIDDGFIFSRKTLKGNRAKNMEGVISRVYMWQCFASISDELNLSFNTSCHQLRKSFAVFLYRETGNNMAMVMEAVGWSSDKILLRYLSITKEQVNCAVSKFQERYV